MFTSIDKLNLIKTMSVFILKQMNCSTTIKLNYYLLGSYLLLLNRNNYNKDKKDITIIAL